MLLYSGPSHPKEDPCLKKMMKIPSNSPITRGGRSVPPQSFRFVKNPDMERVKTDKSNYSQNKTQVKSIKIGKNLGLLVGGC